MSDTVPGERVLIRPRRATWMSASLAVLLLAVFVVVAVLLRRSETGVIFQTSEIGRAHV